MLNKNIEGILSKLYFDLRDKPGWVNSLRDRACYPEEWIDYLCELDDAYSQVWKKHADVIRDIMKIIDIGLFDIEDDDKKIEFLNGQIFAAYEDYNKHYRTGGKPIDRMLMMEIRRVDYMERTVRKLRADQLHKTRPPSADMITDEMIERARQYPMELLAGGDARKFRLPCPFHKGEDRNATIKNGWFYCFKCGVSADTIKWVMELEGKTFPDAVRRLQ